MGGAGGRRLGKPLGAALGAASLLVAPVARADSVTIVARGTIASGCSVALASNFPAANLSASGTVSATAIVDCNTGFVIKATSAKGAIKTTNAASTGFTNVLPYNLSLSVPRDTGGPVSATCAAATLIAGQAGCALSPAGAGLSSGGVTATAKTATLTASWTLPTQKLAAGSYSDTITILVSTSP